MPVSVTGEYKEEVTVSTKRIHIQGEGLLPLPEQGTALVLRVNGWPTPARVLEATSQLGLLPTVTVSLLGRDDIVLSVMPDGRIDEDVWLERRVKR